jgi:hypothetical protein
VTDPVNHSSTDSGNQLVHPALLFIYYTSCFLFRYRILCLHWQGRVKSVVWKEIALPDGRGDRTLNLRSVRWQTVNEPCAVRLGVVCPPAGDTSRYKEMLC